MRNKKPNDYPIKSILELYEKLIAVFPDIDRKGKTTPYTSVNGYMFSFLDKDGQLSIRLSEAHRAELIKKYDAELSVQHGRIMKEFVLVPEKLLSDSMGLRGYFKKGFDYTGSLKPKPSKKKK